MDIPMTPEIIAAIAGLLLALGYGIKQISTAFNSWVETRNNIQSTMAQNDVLKAEAHARDIDAENEQQAKIISILERQTEYSYETAKRFATIAEDFATYQNRGIEVNDRVSKGLSEMAAENKALRISLEAWPATVDTTLGALVKKVTAVETAITTGNVDHTEIKRILENDVVVGIEKIVTLLSPPTPPGSQQPPPGNVRPLNADGAASDATVSADDGGSQQRKDVA